MDKLSQISRVTIAVFSILCAIIGYLIQDKLNVINDGILEVKDKMENIQEKYIEHEIRITKLEAKKGIDNSQ